MVLRLAFATALAAWLVGCHGDCSTYDCPYPNNAVVLLPSGSSAPLVSVAASPPCSTSFSAGDFEGALVVRVAGSSSVTCRVDGTLGDGTRLEALITFQTTPCCEGLTPVNPYVSLGAVDAGTTTD
jgi:hypothetical protein